MLYLWEEPVLDVLLVDEERDSRGEKNIRVWAGFVPTTSWFWGMYSNAAPQPRPLKSSFTSSASLLQWVMRSFLGGQQMNYWLALPSSSLWSKWFFLAILTEATKNIYFWEVGLMRCDNLWLEEERAGFFEPKTSLRNWSPEMSSGWTNNFCRGLWW